MKYLPEYFYSKLVRTALDDLIVHDDKQSFNQLTDHDKEKLCGVLIHAHVMSSELKGDEACFLTESKHADQTINMLAKFLRDGELSKDDFLDTLKANVVDYFEDRMKVVFEQRVDEINYEKLEEKGFVSRECRENGETYWILANS